MSLLSIKKVNKLYSLEKNSTTVLHNISFEMEQNEFVAVMGPSGCGKSTFLYIASGMDYATSGEVYLLEQSLENLSEKELADIRLQKMGFVFQQMYFMKNLNLYDNIVLPAYTLAKVNRNEINKMAIKLMHSLGIEKIKEHYISQASGGQLQRACICRALINQPNILFADEPTGALNSSAAKEVMNIFTEINHAGTAILLVTHDSNVASYAQRVIYMLDGCIYSELLLKDCNEIERKRKVQKWLNDISCNLDNI